jgi:predicted ATPase
MPRLQKIDQIKGYKSYDDYRWDEFGTSKKDDKTDEQTVEFNAHFNVVFGENGSGKSCVAEILKNLAGVRPFKTAPEKVRLSFLTEGVVNFASGEWDSLFCADEFMFFDSDFVSRNVHTHGTRDGTHGGHKQNAGNLILSVDEKYQVLHDAVNDAKQALQEQRENRLVKEQDITSDQIIVFDKAKALSDQEKATRRAELINKKKVARDQLAQLGQNKTKLSEIAEIAPPKPLKNNCLLSQIGRYKAVFDNLLNAVHFSVSAELIQKINANRSFYETGAILSGKGHICPFCQQEYQNSAQKLIAAYKQIFDVRYAEQKSRQLVEIDALLSEMEMSEKAELFLRKELLSKISEYQGVATKYGLDKLDAQSEQNLYRKIEFSTTQLKKLRVALEALKAGEMVSFNEHSYLAAQEFDCNVENSVRELNIQIQKWHDKIELFKKENSSPTSVDEKIADYQSRLTALEFELNCFDSEWVKRQDEIQEAKNLLKKLEADKTSAKEVYDTYCANRPAGVVEKIEKMVNEHFAFKFKLSALSPVRNTNEYPFDFEVLDANGNKRDFSDGLSEGERQIISLCFFFATIPESGVKDKIIVFDDPITSLDSRNLKKLVELITTQCKDAQTFILTHHPLFYKYLVKSLQPSSFGILRNQNSFGGSFIYPENRRLTILDRLKGIPDKIKEQLQAGEMDAQAFTLEYGHLLRYAIEKFVKDGLQGWNVVTFEQRIQKFRDKPPLTDREYDSIKSIYDFCNWSNHLHPDKEDPAALNELLVHVETFIQIAEPHKELWV